MQPAQPRQREGSPELLAAMAEPEEAAWEAHGDRARRSAQGFIGCAQSLSTASSGKVPGKGLLGCEAAAGGCQGGADHIGVTHAETCQGKRRERLLKK